jgi:transcriptional regulator with XRE-family HTH domain
MATFSERMRELRKEKRISLEKLAEMMGTTKATLSRYENSKRVPNIEFVEKLAKIFNVSVDYLLGHTDIRNPADEITEAVEDDPELLEFWNELKQREDLNSLLTKSKIF